MDLTRAARPSRARRRAPSPRSSRPSATRSTDSSRPTTGRAASARSRRRSSRSASLRTGPAPAACCDVLRIYAPHAPYSNGELVAGFQVITEQLTRLSAEVPNATLTEPCTWNRACCSTSCRWPRSCSGATRCQTREKVVTLFAKLFAATRYDYAGHYLEWVKRLHDTEPAIHGQPRAQGHRDAAPTPRRPAAPRRKVLGDAAND
ncbi:hypothetical protein M885DRAFT_623874, partial [Pelagophyceae sp. CCMP2097]